MFEMIDLGAMLNIAVSVSAGSIAATLIVYKLISYFSRKALLAVLHDKNIQQATTSFIEDHVIVPFNNLENHDDLKNLIAQTAEKTLELALEKIKEKGGK